MLMQGGNWELRPLGWLLHGVGFLTLVVGCAATCFGVFRPLELRQRQCIERTDALVELLRGASAVRQEHVRLSKWLADLEERAKAIRKRIPDEPQGAEFLRLLTSSADQEGVKILNFRTGAPAPQEGLSKLTLELTLEGDYPNLCGFFDRLARIPRVATVDKLNLEGLTESSQYPVEMTLVLYFGMRTAGGAARRNRHDAT